MMLRILTASVIATTLFSCSEAKFAGTNPHRSRTEPKSDAPKGPTAAPENPTSIIATNGVSCTITPAVVKVGGAATVNVSSTAGETELFQTVVIGEMKTETLLAKSGSAYAGQASAPAAGLYKVEIRKLAGSAAADAICEFNATADGTMPQTPTNPANPANPSTPSDPANPSTPSDPSTPANPANPSTPSDPSIPANPSTPSDPSNPSTPSDPSTPANPSTPSTPSTPTTPSNPIDPVPPCEDTETSIGAHLTFMIDNSNSNAATDCPSPTKVGRFQNADLYECGGETNREKAVLAAFDLLNAVAAKEPGNAMAISSLALTSFPTRANYVDGFAKETNGMIEVSAQSRGQIASAMAFARKPFGLTPYGAALEGAQAQFAGLADDGKAKVAVLVTDGEPTDQDPAGVAATAQALRAQGIDVITVFYTGAESREARQSKHIAMLKQIDDASRSSGHGTWYSNALGSFDNYIKTLLGGVGQKSLAQQISSGIVEIKDSSSLEQAFLAIIKTKAIQCQR